MTDILKKGEGETAEKFNGRNTTHYQKRLGQIAQQTVDQDQVRWMSDPLRRQLEISSWIETQSQHSSSIAAWSCTNLLALPTRRPPSNAYPSSFGSKTVPPLPAEPLSVTLTHFTGIPTHSSAKRERTSKPTPKLSFELKLPDSLSDPTNSSMITYITFAPCGGYLLMVRSDPHEDCLIIYENKDGAINDWVIIWNERASTFGHPLSSVGKRLVSMRWIGESRRAYKTPDDAELKEPDGSTRAAKPFFWTQSRTSPVIGCAMVAVMSTNELLFLHFNRSKPLLPLSVTLPLSSPLSLTALPTPPTQAKPALMEGIGINADPFYQPSPQAAIDDLVANLVDGMPTNGPSPRAVIGALGLNVGEPNKAGLGAMKEELKAAERREEAVAVGGSLTVHKAALGFAKARNSVNLGISIMMIATVSSPTALTPPEQTSASSQLESLGLTAPIKLGPSFDDPFDMGNLPDFDGLDEALGEPSPDKKVIESVEDEGEDKEQKPTRISDTVSKEKKVELCELRVEMSAQDGPRLSLRPVSPLHLSDPCDAEAFASGTLTHLQWLEDVDRSSPDLSHDQDVNKDLRLLAVHTLPSESGMDSFPASSQLTTWEISKEMYSLADTFSSLECKKTDVLLGEREWINRRAASTNIEALVTFVLPRSAPGFGTFVVGALAEKGTTVQIYNSSSLERQQVYGEPLITTPVLLDQAAVSPNHGLICMTNMAPYQPLSAVIAALPIAGSDAELMDALSTQIAIGLAQQKDVSDVLGRLSSLSDQSLLHVTQRVRDILQQMLPPTRRLHNTALEFELLGFISSLFSQRPSLALECSIASDFLQLATCVRAFDKSEKKDRGVMTAGYRCESDAVWPLIGHVSWYCQFAWDLLNKSKASQGDKPAPFLLLLLHPISRDHLLRAVECCLGLQAFLASFTPEANFTVDVARAVLDDAVDANELVMRCWRTTLQSIADLPGLTGDTEELENMIKTFTIPPSFSEQCESISTLLTSPALYRYLKSPPTLPKVSTSNALSKLTASSLAYVELDTDVMRHCRLPVGKRRVRQCTKCADHMTEIKAISLGGDFGAENSTEMGRWSAYVLGWESRCFCGGLWIAEEM